MAREYGIAAFCYYHYWFAGRRLLERPFQEVLASGEPDFPFCICWANQSWTGIWHGSPNKILIEQTYPGSEDYRSHFYTLLNAFTDQRYITVDEKPIFLIYCPGDIPDIRRVADFWRGMAIKSGLKGLYLIGVQGNPVKMMEQYGLDASVMTRLPSVRPWISWRSPIKRLTEEYGKRTRKPTIYSYKEVSNSLFNNVVSKVNNYPCIIPNWDNTPRSESNGLVLHGSTPELFRSQVKAALELVGKYSKDKKLIFIKSWNEWAEGNHLEPDLKFGKAYLQVIKEEILK